METLNFYDGVGAKQNDKYKKKFKPWKLKAPSQYGMTGGIIIYFTGSTVGALTI
jgi:hypothetical protein